MCDEPPEVLNAEIISHSQKYKVGTIVSYRCNSRYYIEGSSDVECKAMNHQQPVWDNPPRCYDVNDCGDNNKVIIQKADGYYCGEYILFYLFQKRRK